MSGHRFSWIRFFRQALICLLIVFATQQCIQAQTAGRAYQLRYRLPQPSSGRPSYSLMDLKLTTYGIVPASDDHFDIRIKISNRGYRWNGGIKHLSLETQIVIHAGNKSGTGQILVPSYLLNSDLTFEFEVVQSGGTAWTEVVVYPQSDSVSESMLFIFDKEIGTWQNVDLLKRGQYRDTRASQVGSNLPTNQFPAFHQINNNNFNATSALAYQQGGVIAWTPDLLPDHWVGLSQFESIIVSKTEWDQIVFQTPAKRDAIVDWIYAGGNLLIYDRNGVQNANAIRRSLARNLAERKSLEQTAWCEPVNPNEYADNRGMGAIHFGSSFSYQPIKTGDIQDSKKSVGSLPIGLGSLNIAVKPIANWQYSDWQQVKLDAGNEYYGNGNMLNSTEGFRSGFKIPGVGQPPVIGFRVLILIFVALIGPFNYVFLRRIKRLNLLLLTVPAISLLTCATLLAFALFNDGFGLYGRLESVSTLDQRTGQLVSDSRHKYFGATVPRDGYAFDKRSMSLLNYDTGSLPVAFREQESGYSISGAEIRSRTEHQFYVRNVQPTNVRLDFETDSDGNLVLHNHLGGNIRYVLVRQAAKYYYAENLEDGEFVILQEGHISDLEIDLGTVCSQMRPVEAEDDDYYGYYTPGMLRSMPYSGFRTNQDITRLRRRQVAIYLDEPYSYVAILDDFAEVPARSSDAQIRKQIHVVKGIWK